MLGTTREEDVLHRGRRPGAHAQHASLSSLDDGGLLSGNLLEGVAQDAAVVKSDSRDAGGNRVRGARGVPPAAQADLEHGNVNPRLGKYHAGSHGEQVELGDAVRPLPRLLATRVHAAARLSRQRDAMREGLVAHGATIDLHALAHLDQLGRSIEGAAQALAAQDRRRIAARRGLAIGAGDLDDVKGRIGAAQLIEHVDHGLEQGVPRAAEEPRVMRHALGLLVAKLRRRKRRGPGRTARNAHRTTPCKEPGIRRAVEEQMCWLARDALAASETEQGLA